MNSFLSPSILARSYLKRSRVAISCEYLSEKGLWQISQNPSYLRSLHLPLWSTLWAISWVGSVRCMVEYIAYGSPLILFWKAKILVSWLPGCRLSIAQQILCLHGTPHDIGGRENKAVEVSFKENTAVLLQKVIEIFSGNNKSIHTIQPYYHRIILKIFKKWGREREPEEKTSVEQEAWKQHSNFSISYFSIDLLLLSTDREKGRRECQERFDVGARVLKPGYVPDVSSGVQRLRRRIWIRKFVSRKTFARYCY